MMGLELNQGKLFVNGQEVGEIHLMDFVDIEPVTIDKQDGVALDLQKELCVRISMTEKNTKKLMRKIRWMVRCSLVKQFFHI